MPLEKDNEIVPSGVGKVLHVAEGDTKTGEPSPFVKPGQPLGYVNKLKEAGLWPLKRSRQFSQKEKGATITPFIVVPGTATDDGTRPIPDQQAHFNQSVLILDAGGHPVLSAMKDSTYQLQCLVTNRGGCGAFGGIVEFYVVPSTTLDTLTPNSLLRPQGYAGFSALPGGKAVVKCPNPWKPVTDAEAASSVVVQAYDAFADQVKYRFDAGRDRHVGRRDRIPDFSGTWEGEEFANTHHYQVPVHIRIVISQTLLTVNASFSLYLPKPVDGITPALPQENGTGSIVNGQVRFSIIEYLTDRPFTNNTWVMSLTPNRIAAFYSLKGVLGRFATANDYDRRSQSHLIYELG